MPGTSTPPLFLQVLMDKESGLTIQVIDSTGINRSIVTMNGATIQLTEIGPSGVSTITQTCDTITVDVQNFIVNANTIAMNSVTVTNLNSAGVTNVTSTGGINETTPATLTQNAVTSVLVNTDLMNVVSLTEIALTSPAGNVNITGGIGVEVASAAEVAVAAANVTIGAAAIELATAALVVV